MLKLTLGVFRWLGNASLRTAGVDKWLTWSSFQCFTAAVAINSLHPRATR